MLLSKIFNRSGKSHIWSRSARGLLLFFLCSLILLSAAGIIFKVVFIAYNHGSVGDLSWREIVYALFWGLRFDLASAAIFSLLISIFLWPVYRTTKDKVSPSNTAALVLLSISLIVQMSFQVSDSIYYTDAGRHVSYEMRDVVADASGLLLTAITYHARFILYSAILGLCVLLMSLRFTHWFMSKTYNKERVSWKYNLQYEASLLLIVFIAVICIRGGVTDLPQSVISAFKIGNSQQAVVAMNGSYSVIYGVINGSKEVKRLAIKLPEGVDTNEVMRELYPDVSFGATNKQGKKYNLIFVFMEGWPAEIMASYGYDQVTTPFFDSMLKKSLSPLGVIAGGRRTTEGLFATLCSQQNPLGETVSQSSLQNFSYRCLPEILKNKGWSTAFFQGSHKETSGTGAFAQSLGFVDSYAKEDMPEGRYKRNFWGVHDPDIYDFAIARIDEMPEPFMIGINTNSTHDTRLPEGIAPFFEKDKGRDNKRDILHFSDDAMRGFFDKLKDKPYYKKTLFVFMSDHTSGRRNSRFSSFLIPGAIYAEDIVPAGKINRFVSQRDIAPTILELLGFSSPPSFSGKSFYISDENELSDNIYFSDYYDAGSIGWVSDREIVETNINQPEVMNCYSVDTEKMAIAVIGCDDKNKRMSEQSLVFTSYSQERLFKGETKQFFKFVNE